MACNEEDINYSLSNTILAYVTSLNKWILTTRATYHLCASRELFTNLCDLESTVVIIRNDNLITKMRMGTV